MSQLRKAAQRVLGAIERALPYAPHRGEFDQLADVADDLLAALAESERDWSLLQATQESLREHMAEIQRLRAALAEPQSTHSDECYQWHHKCAVAEVKRLRAALAEPVQEPVELFVVKHYVTDERPIIKGNGFDGLEVGTDREEADQFIAWINARITTSQCPAETEQEPVAWANMKDGEPVLLSISQHPEDRANWRNPIPLYTAPPRLHEAHDWQYKMAGERLRRIEKLEAQRDALLEALKYHQEQTRPIQKTIDAIKAAEEGA